MKKYFLPTKIIFGEKSFRQLFDELSAAGVKRPLVVCGRHFLVSMKFRDIEENLGMFELFTGIGPNPKTSEVDDAAKMLNSKGCDAVIGIGGGSVLDAAKVAACMKGCKKSCETFYKKISVKKQAPFFALPTTSGSGSEATKYSVLTTRAGIKRTLKDNKFYAKVAIVDPELTYSMPPEVTAATGIDAFCQAVEAHWAKTATPETRAFSSESMGLSYHSLFKAVNDPDKQSRQNMSLASLRAAQAFSNTGTTACHSISYAITKRTGLVHGFAVALTLPWFLRFYSEKKRDACLEICGMLGEKTIEGGAEKIRGLMESVGAPTALRQIGLKYEDFPEIIADSLAHKPANPRKHTAQDLERMLKEIF